MSENNSIDYWKLKFQRKFSQVFGTDVFSTIYKGELKGYKFISNTPDNYFNNEYELDSFSHVLDQLKKNPELVIYDLGANLGYFSLLCAAVSSKSTIFSFEPIPANMNIFCRHLLINNVKNVKPVNLAVSDHLGFIDFSAENLSHSYTYKQSSAHYGNRQLNLKVGVTSLDIFIDQYGYAKPDIIKVDVEGAEYDVLLGAAKIIEKYKPKILLATHEAHEKGVEEKCRAFLKNANYSCLKLNDVTGRPKGLDDYWCVPN